MSPDAAADAIATLPHDQFRGVLNPLPSRRRDDVSMLLGYNPTTAGGLMGVDFLAVARDTSAGQALALVAGATGVEPQALSSVYLLDDNTRLRGAVALVRLVQAEPSTPMSQLADPEPMRVSAHADAVDVAVLMCDHNLLSLPVADPQDRMIGLITVDDVLDTTIPAYWRRRTTNAPAQPEPPPNSDEAR
jgi:Mg/Co/Ni transporter MgtE